MKLLKQIGIKSKFFAMLFIVVLASCGEEVILDNTIKNINAVISYNSVVPGMDVIALPEYIVQISEPYNTINQDKIESTITEMYEYLDKIYLIIPDEYRIISVDMNDYKLIAEYDFSDLGLKPKDMCFPNGTDAYVIHQDTALYSVLDIYNGVIFDHFDIYHRPIDIASMDNRVFVALPKVNKVVVISTSTRLPIDTIVTHQIPILLDVAEKSNELIVISLGLGKSEYDNYETPTVSKISFIDIETFEIISATDLDYGSINANDIYPTDIVSTYQEWSYISTNKGVLRVDNRFRNRITPTYGRAFDRVYYANQISSLLLLYTEGDKSSITLLDMENTNNYQTIEMNNTIETILPLSK